MVKSIIKYSLITFVAGLLFLIFVKEQNIRGNRRFFSYLCSERGLSLSGMSYVIYFNPECELCKSMISQINDFKKVLLISPADSSKIRELFLSNNKEIPSNIIYDHDINIGEFLSIDGVPSVYKITETKAYSISAVNIINMK